MPCSGICDNFSNLLTIYFPVVPSSSSTRDDLLYSTTIYYIIVFSVPDGINMGDLPDLSLILVLSLAISDLLYV